MRLVQLLVDVPSDVADEAAQLLMELGAGAVEERTTERGGLQLIVYGDDVQALTRLSEHVREAFEAVGLDAGTYSLRLTVDEHSEWATEWTRYLRPQRITSRWVVQPLGSDEPIPAGAGRILIRPTLAFGDGAHATTRLAAQVVERFCLDVPGARVLDVGTGTGVLAMVAALTGASHVVGTDVDGVALAAARENAALNGLADAIRFQEPTAPLDADFDLIVANLPPRPLLEEAPRLGARARSARALVVTGFLEDQAAEVREQLARLGLRERERRDEDGWSLLVLSPR